MYASVAKSPIYAHKWPALKSCPIECNFYSYVGNGPVKWVDLDGLLLSKSDSFGLKRKIVTTRSGRITAITLDQTLGQVVGKFSTQANRNLAHANFNLFKIRSRHRKTKLDIKLALFNLNILIRDLEDFDPCIDLEMAKNLYNHFGIEQPQQNDGKDLAKKYEKILSGVDNWINSFSKDGIYYVPPQSQQRPAVRAFVFPSRPSDVYVADPFFRNSALQRSGIFVHEASHYKSTLGTKDHTYGHTNSLIEALFNGQPFNNADNYECFYDVSFGEICP